MTAHQRTTIIIALVMAESILHQVAKHLPGNNKNRLRWFAQALDTFSRKIDNGKPLSSTAKKAVDRFDDRFIDASRSLPRKHLPPAVQALALIEATNILLYDIPAHCPEMGNAMVWKSLARHHSALLESNKARLTDFEAKTVEYIGTAIYLDVADYLNPKHQDRLLRAA